MYIYIYTGNLIHTHIVECPSLQLLNCPLGVWFHRPRIFSHLALKSMAKVGSGQRKPLCFCATLGSLCRERICYTEIYEKAADIG